MSIFELGEEVDFVLLGNYFYRGIIVGRKTTHCKGMWEESYDIDMGNGNKITDVPEENIIKPEKKEGFTLTEETKNILEGIQRPKLPTLGNDALDAYEYAFELLYLEKINKPYLPPFNMLGKDEKKGKIIMTTNPNEGFIKDAWLKALDAFPFMHFELPKEQKENEMIPTYIGYKNRTVTLVWSDGSKTQAIAKENEEVYFLYGFLIAYYKKVNEQLSSKEIQHRLENIVYLREKEFQYGYLTSVFRENCGLSIRKQDQFIGKYIYSIAPFEIEQENFAKTYKIDDKFRT